MQIRSIQVLRALAASSVVLIHAANRTHSTWPDLPAVLNERRLYPAHAGVDLFFVLSGFLMAYLHHDMFGEPGAPRKFFSRRLIRIVPIYWLLSAFALALAILVPQLMDDGRRVGDWAWLLGDFAFVPWPDGAGNVGRLLIVGWTLDFEMFFYVMFSVALFLPRGLTILAITMVSLVLTGWLVKPSHPVLMLVTSPMLLEFLGGMLVASITRRQPVPPSRALAWALLIVGLAGLPLSLVAETHRAFTWGVPAVCIVLATLWLQFECTGVLGRVLTVAGDASYSIYLTQVFSLPALAILFRFSGLRLPADLTSLMLWLGACGLGVAFWWTVERPITELLKRAIAPKRVLDQVAARG